jgi:hypothetical protein
VTRQYQADTLNYRRDLFFVALKSLLGKNIRVVLGPERPDFVTLPRNGCAIPRHHALPDSPLPTHNPGIFSTATT